MMQNLSLFLWRAGFPWTEIEFEEIFKAVEKNKKVDFMFSIHFQIRFSFILLSFVPLEINILQILRKYLITMNHKVKIKNSGPELFIFLIFVVFVWFFCFIFRETLFECICMLWVEVQWLEQCSCWWNSEFKNWTLGFF